jgi:hypothetical protein
VPAADTAIRSVPLPDAGLLRSCGFVTTSGAVKHLHEQGDDAALCGIALSWLRGAGEGCCPACSSLFELEFELPF